MLARMLPSSGRVPPIRWPEHVCLVGNGPLSSKDRELIAACPFIVRFNDMKNREQGERTDLLILRKNSEVMSLFGFGNNYHGERWCGKLPVAVIRRPTINVLPRCNVVGQVRMPNHLFGMPVFANGSVWGATSGAIVLQDLELNSNRTRTVETFGMNFARPSNHSRHVKGEDAVLRQHLRKTIVHPTARNTYLP